MFEFKLFEIQKVTIMKFSNKSNFQILSSFKPDVGTWGLDFRLEYIAQCRLCRRASGSCVLCAAFIADWCWVSP